MNNYVDKQTEYAVVNSEVGFALIQKCANQALIQHCGKDFFKPEDIESLKHRVAFIRDPHERHISAWSFFYNLCYLGTTKFQGWDDFSPATYQEYVDYTFRADRRARHWMTQNELHFGKHQAVQPTVLVKFDHLHEVVEFFTGRKPAYINHLPTFPWEPYREQELKQRYAVDDALYQAAFNLDEFKVWASDNLL